MLFLLKYADIEGQLKAKQKRDNEKQDNRGAIQNKMIEGQSKTKIRENKIWAP